MHKIEYDVEGNKTIMDLYYETGCVFRETYIDGKLISIECPKEQNTESFITSSIHKLISTCAKRIGKGCGVGWERR